MLLLVLLVACSDPANQAPVTGSDNSQSPTIESTSEWMSEAVIGEHNAAVASMGAFNYPEAVAGFEGLLSRYPDWDFARVNLAIATLNRQQPGDEDAALAMAAEVLSRDPDHLRALYISGILYFNRGDVEQAESFFSRVHSLDPKDAFAAYYTGQCRLQLGQSEDALALFDQAIDADPYLRSAYYGAFQARQRQGDRDAALAYLADYQRLDQNPRSTLAEIKYTRMGQHAMVLPIRQTSSAVASARDASKFDHGVSLSTRSALVPELSSNHSLANAVLIDAQTSLLLIADAEQLHAWELRDGEWQSAVDLPFLNTPDVNSISFGDVDSDGLTDLYLGRAGQDQLWQQTEAGWVLNDLALAEVLDAVLTHDSQWVDADHDGDLDILLRTEQGARLINNDGDGSFRDLTSTALPEWQQMPLRQLMVEDIDADRDLDLVAVDVQGRVWLYRNDRLWSYHHEALFDSGPAVAIMQWLDMDVDGQVEAYSVTETGALIRQTVGKDPASFVTLIKADPSSAQPIGRLWRQDINADGLIDLLLATESGFVAVNADGEILLQASDSSRLLGLLQDRPKSGPALLIQNGNTVYRQSLDQADRRYLALSFSGQESSGESMRSNPSGLGTGFVVRTGSVWASDRLLRQHAGPGSDLQPVSIGLGQAEQADYVAIEWSDGVFQTESRLQAGQWHSLTETQRQLASCPVVFIDQGQGYEFVTDILGVGGIGFNTGFGEYAAPRPFERIVLPIRDQQFKQTLRIKISEPMEEIAYIDHVELMIVDTPPGYQMVLNERLAMNGPEPDSSPLLYRDYHHPVSASMRSGTSEPVDVLNLARQSDLQPIPVGHEHKTLKGLLEQEMIIELQFNTDLGLLKQPALQMDGWVEYGYSQTSFAAWQAGRVYDGLSLERRNSEGEWVRVIESFGYPAGMPRESVLMLQPLPLGTRELRLRTHQQIYLDRLVMLDVDAQVQPQIHSIQAAHARVSQPGYPRRTDGPQYQPSYDDRDRQPFWDTRYPSGFYTALGEARELIAVRDNALAIIGPADALELTFADTAPKLHNGWRRYWVLSTIGWAKDMDLYTNTGETVAPLPAHPELDLERARQLNSTYNTRFQSGH